MTIYGPTMLCVQLYASSPPSQLCLRSKAEEKGEGEGVDEDWEIIRAPSGMSQGGNVIIENSKRECALNYLGNLAHKLTAILSWPGLKLRIFYKTYCYIVDSLSFSSCSHHLHHHDDDKIFVSALIRFGLFYLLNYCGTLEPIIIRLIIIISSCRCFFSPFLGKNTGTYVDRNEWRCNGICF